MTPAMAEALVLILIAATLARAVGSALVGIWEWRESRRSRQERRRECVNPWVDSTTGAGGRARSSRKESGR